MAQYTHDVRSDDDGDSVDSHYSDSDHGHSDYEENAHACHDESDDDKANESIVKYRAIHPHLNTIIQFFPEIRPYGTKYGRRTRSTTTIFG